MIQNCVRDLLGIVPVTNPGQFAAAAAALALGIDRLVRSR